MGHDDGNADIVVPMGPDPAPGADARTAAVHRTARTLHARARPGALVAIAAGGALGVPARYGMSRMIHAAPGQFPWATFWTNITGSLVLGFLLVLLIERFPPSRHLRPFFATGFLGAYTTFSTYMVETDVLVKDGHVAIGVSYLLASALAGFAAVWVGIMGGRLVPVARAHHAHPGHHEARARGVE